MLKSSDFYTFTGVGGWQECDRRQFPPLGKSLIKDEAQLGGIYERDGELKLKTMICSTYTHMRPNTYVRHRVRFERRPYSTVAVAFAVAKKSPSVFPFLCHSL